MPINVWVWLAVIIVLSIIEAVSLNLITIWFAVGGLGAMITSFFTDNWVLQIFVFALVSAIALILTKPFVNKLKKKESPTNADRIIGEKGIVLKRVNDTDLQGQVKAMGQIWAAKSADGSVIPEGAWVEVLKIEGVKLIVKRMEEK